LTEISLLLLSVAGQRGEDLMSRGSKKAPCEPVVDARSKRKRREANRSILATLPRPDIPLIVMDSTDDDEEEDEDVLPFSLNRSFESSFPDEGGITLEHIEAVAGTIPWAEKEDPCERPRAKKTASQDGGKGRRSKTHSDGPSFVDDVAPKPRTVKAKISDESEDYPDFELAEDSGSGDSEAEDEQKDPLDWAWKEFAIMLSQQVWIFKPHHSFAAFFFLEKSSTLLHDVFFLNGDQKVFNHGTSRSVIPLACLLSTVR
jgi:hypothetical protein